MKMKTLIGAGILGILSVLVLLAMPGGVGCGRAGVTFKFHLVDSGMGHAIEGAEIRVLGSDLINYSELLEQRELLLKRKFMAYTDKKGNADLFAMCGAGWNLSLFGGGTLRVSHLLQISADGYYPVSVPLESVIGGPRWSVSKGNFDIVMHLISKKADQFIPSTPLKLRD